MNFVPRGTKVDKVKDIPQLPFELKPHVDSFPCIQEVVSSPDGSDTYTKVAEMYRSQVLDSVEVSLKYKGYIDRERVLADKLRRLEYIVIPEGYDFSKIAGLSIECRQKLEKYRPATIGQASRISGVSPSDISVLLIYFNR